MVERIRFSGWAAWLDEDGIWWCQDEHCGSAPMQPRTGFEEDMLDEIRRLRAELAAYKRVVDAARAVISNPAYQGICDEDVELEQAVAALAAKGE